MYSRMDIVISILFTPFVFLGVGAGSLFMETGGRGRASVTCCAIVPAPFKLYVKNY